MSLVGAGYDCKGVYLGLTTPFFGGKTPLDKFNSSPFIPKGL